MNYKINKVDLDSIDLKCMVVSRGVKVHNDVYSAYKDKRLGINPLMCNCFKLSDGTVVQLTDVGFHLKYLTGILSLSNLKLLKYASELKTPFSIRLFENKAALFYENDFLDFITFFEKSAFYSQKTSSNTPFIGNSVLQGSDWVAFQCLWPCDYAACQKPCEFCFSGGDFANLAKKISLCRLPYVQTMYMKWFCLLFRRVQTEYR